MRAGLSTDSWKRGLVDYVSAARTLFKSVQRDGVLLPVPIDPNGDLLDGSHRVACALALDIAEVPVSRRQDYVWAPPWGHEWFVSKKMNAANLDRLLADWAEITA